MNRVSFVIFISLLTIIHSTYNPIPVGCVIISTINKIFIMQPIEYGGKDELDIIYTATDNMTIINTIYDPSLRNLYILFTNTTNGTIYLCQLDSLEQLDSIVYQLPISFDITNLSQLNSFSSDIVNRRVFFTDQTSTVTLFSMSGLMETKISTPINPATPIRSVSYNNMLNQLFIITDTTVDSCSNLDTNNLQCCEGLPRGNKFRSIAFDQISGVLYVYILDENRGIYQVILNSAGCPTAFRPINTLGTYSNLQFVVDQGLCFASGSSQTAQNNSLLIIGNVTENLRTISVGTTIVALHISPPNTQSTYSTVETCWNGITYSNYRLAVVLAALFGTIMGIFMCVNALFCIDFFMTKRIIRNLKQQIPHNLLEDRWNKLVEEKYAKIALEKQRTKDDPPPIRKPSIIGRKTSSAATVDNNDSNQASREGTNTNDSLRVPKPRPTISAYLRRKSESYLSRRRSDDYRTQRQQARGEQLNDVRAQRQQARGEQLNDSRPYPQRNPITTAQVHIAPVKEEDETRRGLRQNLSRRELLEHDEDFL